MNFLAVFLTIIGAALSTVFWIRKQLKQRLVCQDALIVGLNTQIAHLNTELDKHKSINKDTYIDSFIVEMEDAKRELKNDKADQAYFRLIGWLELEGLQLADYFYHTAESLLLLQKEFTDKNSLQQASVFVNIAFSLNPESKKCQNMLRFIELGKATQDSKGTAIDFNKLLQLDSGYEKLSDERLTYVIEKAERDENLSHAHAMSVFAIYQSENKYGQLHEKTLHRKLKLSAILIDLKQLGEAKDIIDETLPLAEKILGLTHSHTLMGRHLSGRLHQRLGDEIKAEFILTAVIDDFRNSTNNLDDKSDRSVSAMIDLSQLLNKQERWKECEELSKEAQSICSRSINDVTPLRRLLVADLLTTSLKHQGKLKELIEPALEALAYSHQIKKPTLNVKIERVNIASSLAYSYDQLRFNDKHLSIRVEYLDDAEAVFGYNDEKFIRWRLRLANSMIILGGRDGEAEKIMRSCYEDCRLYQERTAEVTVSTTTSLANVLILKMNQYEEAEELTAITIADQIGTSDRRRHDFVLLLTTRILLLLKMGLQTEAEIKALQKERIQINTILWGEWSEAVFENQKLMIEIHIHAEEYEVATSLCETLLKQVAYKFGRLHYYTLYFRFQLQMLSTINKQYEDTIKLALPLWRSTQISPSFTEYGHTILTGAGVSFNQLKQFEEAEFLLEFVWSRNRKTLGQDHEITLNTQFLYGKILLKLECYEVANELLLEVWTNRLKNTRR